MKYAMIILLLAVALVGCDDSDDGLTQHMAEETVHYAWTVDGVDILTLDNINGAVTVHAADDDSIRAEVIFSCTADTEDEAEDHISDIEFTDSVNGNRLQLVVELPSDTDFGYDVTFDISLPADIELSIVGVNGLIDVVGFASQVYLGLVNGNIFCDMDAVVEGESVYVNTINGSVEVTIPQDSDVEFDLAVVNGTLAVTGFTDIEYTQNDSRRMRGTIGEGLTDVTLGTVNGVVELLAK